MTLIAGAYDVRIVLFGGRVGLLTWSQTHAGRVLYNA